MSSPSFHRLVAGVAWSLAALSLFLSGCSAERTPEGDTGSMALPVEQTVSAVQLVPASVALVEGESTSLEAVVLASDGTELVDASIAWSSTDPTVVAVDATGIVTAVAPGGAQVVAQAGGVEGRATITVSARPVALRIEPVRPVLQVGATLGLRPIVTDSLGEEHRSAACSWSSDEPTVALVTEGGGVRGIAPGTAIATAACEGLEATMPIQIRSGSVLDIVGPDRVVVGGSVQLEARIDGVPTLLADPWASTNPSAATVDPDAGVVSGIETGRTWIHTSLNGLDRSVEMRSVMRFDRLLGPTCGIGMDGTKRCWGGLPGMDPDCRYRENLPPDTDLDCPPCLHDVPYKVVCVLLADGLYRCWGKCTQVPIPYRPTCGVGAGGHYFCSELPLLERAVTCSQFEGHISCMGVPTHECRIEADGRAACQGDNSAGALGDGTLVSRQEWAPVSGNLHFSSFETIVGQTCGISTDGQLYCWGKGVTVPTLATTGTFEDLAAGTFHFCALRSDHVVLCWGDNFKRQSGAPASTLFVTEPQPVFPEDPPHGP